MIDDIHMNSPIPSLRSLAMVLLSLFAFAVAARPETPAPDRSQARFEENFLSDLIDQHFVGAKLAELAASRATHAELRALASMIQTAEEARIENMRAWLKEWYDVDYEPTLDARGERRIAALEELSGEDFEREVMVELALRHADAIEAAGPALLRVYHADLIGLTRDILSLEADELALLRIWFNQWYGVTEVRVDDRGLEPVDTATGTTTGTNGNTTNGTTPAVTAPTAVTTPANTNSVATPTTTVTAPTLTTGTSGTTPALPTTSTSN